MLQIHVETGPDPSLLWLLLLVLAFLLVCAGAGAMAGSRILDGNPPGALDEGAEQAPGDDDTRTD